MREIVARDVLLICVTALVSPAALKTALWPRADDPNWELRWRGLDPGYRNWLAAMTTSRAWLATLTDPGEVALAESRLHQPIKRKMVPPGPDDEAVPTR